MSKSDIPPVECKSRNIVTFANYTKCERWWKSYDKRQERKTSKAIDDSASE